MQRPNPQEIYRHFKGNLYQILTIAKHTETGEELVVYQALYGDFQVYCRPLVMFMSEVDHEKYPEISQKYRFEKVNPAEFAKKPVDEVAKKQDVTPKMEKAAEELTETVDRQEAITSDTSKRESVMNKSIEEEAEELHMDPTVVRFLDADSATDRLRLLSQLHVNITNDMIDVMAMAIGVEIDAGDVEDRYNDLKTCLLTMERFETTRLR